MLTIHLKLSFFFLMDGLVNQKRFFSGIVKSLGLLPTAKGEDEEQVESAKEVSATNQRRDVTHLGINLYI